MLTGGFGDHLYSGAEDWWADLHSDKRLRESARELAYHFRYGGWHWTLSRGFLQRAAKRLLKVLPGGRRLRHRKIVPVWLTPAALEYLSMERIDIAPENRGNLTGALAAMSSSSEIFNSNRHALELRHPYRDRRLVEYALGLPAYLLYYRGSYKRVLRMAMRDILPEAIRLRPRQTSLVSLFSRGTEREKAFLQTCFHSPDAVWRTFVHEDWLFKHWDFPVTADTDGPRALVPWLCLSYASWRQLGQFLN